MVFDFPAHNNSAIKTLQVIKDGPQLITGSADNTIKVWNLNEGTPKLNTTITTPGSVECIQIKDNNLVLFSDNEVLNEVSSVPVGMIRILNQNNPMDMTSSICLKVSLLFLCLFFYLKKNYYYYLILENY